jgi:hypothetical protein
MPYTLEIEYYNTFWLKRTTTPRLQSRAIAGGTGHVYSTVMAGAWPGLPFLDGNDGYPSFPTSTSSPRSNAWPSPEVFDDNNASNWIIEESRIRGGFNNTIMDRGISAFFKLDSNDAVYRSSGLIYSGIYNSRTGFNETNVFSTAQPITKTVDPHNGSIQLIYAMDNNLTVFQENKISTALIDKDAIYSAEGSATLTKSPKVIGQVTPYVGDYGISRNPESFASFGFRRYFTDKDRNAVLRLSRDGITPISKYGMTDYFRDTFQKVNENRQSYLSDEVGLQSQNPPFPLTQPPLLSFAPNFIQVTLLFLPSGVVPIDVEVGSIVEYRPTGSTNWTTSNCLVTGLDTNSGQSDGFIYTNGVVIPMSSGEVRFRTFKKDKIEGSYDNYKNNYIVSIQRRSGSKTTDEVSDYNTSNNIGYYSTIAFDDDYKGWTTFYTYRPDFIISIKGSMYTTKGPKIYLHYESDNNHNEFYGVTSPSSIEFSFNANPSIVKNFKTINYEGDNGWELTSFKSDQSRVISGSTYTDTSLSVKSYEEGLYYENGIPYRAGFHLKENKYYANLVSNNMVRQGEVVFGNSMTGIKGFFATVRLSTDNTTNTTGSKQLFAVSTEIVKSS